jgi:hypothetical protein
MVACTYHPIYSRKHKIGGITVQAGPKVKHYLQNNHRKQEALSSNPSIAKTKQPEQKGLEVWLKR